MAALMTQMAPVALPAGLRFGEVEYRRADLEKLDVDEGTVLMRAVPYNVETELRPQLWESFAPDTFAAIANAPGRCKMWLEHEGPPIGHAKVVEVRPDGLWVQARFSKTPRAAEARELATDGTLDQCSITFRPVTDPLAEDCMTAVQRGDGWHVRHRAGRLLGVALVAHGAYEEHAYVSSVRADQVDAEREERRARLLSYSH
jgi:HK97 family phage prohead protease